MTKDERKIVAASVLFPLSIWLLDAAVDSVLFSKAPFLNSLMFDSPEVYFRLLFLTGFIIFGVIVLRILARHKRMEEALQASEEKFRSLVDSTEDSIYLVDRDYRYLFINKIHLSRLCLPEDKLLEQSYAGFHSPEETKDFTERVDAVFKTGVSVQHEHKSQRDNRYFLRTLSPVTDRGGKITAVTVISKQINERKQMEEELRALLLTDELTGLYNRRGFFTLAGQQLKISSRLKRGVSFLSADLDNLKAINDTLGHKEGDLALIEIADILKESFRESDIIARIGGDEFVILFPANITGDSEMLTARLKRNLEEYNQNRSRGYKLSISFGIAYYDPEEPHSIDELLAQADKMMYSQKRNKPRLVFNTSEHPE